MDPKRCSWHREDEQCPNPWVTWIHLFGKARPVCMEHARTINVEHGNRILDDILFRRAALRGVAEQDEALQRRVEALREKAAQRDRSHALAAYQVGVLKAREAGLDDAQAHEEGLLRVWRAARYPRGDLRREGA